MFGVLGRNFCIIQCELLLSDFKFSSDIGHQKIPNNSLYILLKDHRNFVSFLVSLHPHLIP